MNNIDSERKNVFSEKRFSIIIRSVIVLGLFFFGFAFFLFAYKEHFTLSNQINDSKIANLGSSISGIVGTIFNLVAIILLSRTFQLQKRELASQLEELELTRNELKEQKDQMISQNNIILKQRFEATFFQLVSLHHQIVDGILINRDGLEHRGRGLFSKAFDVMMRSANLYSDNCEELGTSYLKGYKEWRTNLDHYFRNLYHILKFVDSSDLHWDEKYQYSSIIRAQLSSHELLLLFYNCISVNGREKFKPLIEKYHLFKNLPILELAHPNQKNCYSNSAFTKE